MQYRIQFLDSSAKVICEWSANAQSAAGAIELIVDADWPPRAVTMRVLDPYGREVHSDGRLPRGFGVKRLMELPMGWSDQRSALGLKAPAQPQ